MEIQDASQKKSGFAPYMGLTFLIGLGFFTMGLMDPLYDNYVPLFLGQYIKANSLIGTVMTLDNIFALFLIPIVSVWSDRTRSPIGRRMPFIIITLPLTALCFSGLPYAGAHSLAALVILIFFLNIFKQAARGPVVALMPDTIPGDFRSEANGVINTMGGLAAIVGTVGLARLMDLDITLPLIGHTKDKLPFPVAGLLVVLSTMLLFVFVRERQATEKKEEKKSGLGESFRTVAKDGGSSAVRILFALFFWFLGYQGVLPFIGKYGVEVLGLSKGTAALSSGMVAIAYAIFAVPSGYVAHKFGRKSAIRVALLVLTGILALMAAFLPLSSALGLSGMLKNVAFWGLMFVFGAFWVTIITNSFPMLWQMASYGTMGIYTGLYYTFSQAAAIASPPLTGVLIDSFGYPGMFVFGAACMVIAWIIMDGVSKGEATEQGTEKRNEA